MCDTLIACLSSLAIVIGAGNSVPIPRPAPGLNAPAPKTDTVNNGYDAYADAMFRSLPKGWRFRPDLEAYLSGLASSARQRNGASGLKHSSLVTKAARAQAAEMILGNFVGHKSAKGYSFRQRLASYTGHRYSYWAENAARDRYAGPVNKKKAARLFNLWMRSKGHRRNLMRGSFSYVSSGVIETGHSLYAVQIFWEK